MPAGGHAETQSSGLRRDLDPDPLAVAQGPPKRLCSEVQVWPFLQPPTKLDDSGTSCRPSAKSSGTARSEVPCTASLNCASQDHARRVQVCSSLPCMLCTIAPGRCPQPLGTGHQHSSLESSQRRSLGEDGMNMSEHATMSRLCCAGCIDPSQLPTLAPTTHQCRACHRCGLP